MDTRSAPGVLAGYLMPHPPVLVPAVGGGREREADATADACREASARIAAFRPDSIVVLSPHAPLFPDSVFVYPERVVSGSFARFGVPSAVSSYSCDRNLRSDLILALSARGIPSLSRAGEPIPDDGLDHGVLVPLWYAAAANPAVPVVALAPWMGDVSKARLVGEAVAEAAVNAGRRVCVIASGDLSHRVNRESPYGMAREGALFDGAVCDALRSGDLERLFSIGTPLARLAGECGLRSLMALAGLFPRARSEVLSYEAPFGIGYCVAEITPA